MSSKKMQPVTEIYVKLLHVIHEFNEWIESDVESPPTHHYWDAVLNFLGTFNVHGRDIPGIFLNRNLLLAISKFQERLEEFDATDDFYPKADYWECQNDVFKLVSEWPELYSGSRQPSSVFELNRDGVPHDVIAKTWGLLNDDGHPDISLVLKELASPGSVIKKNYKAPGEEFRLKLRKEIDAWIEDQSSFFSPDFKKMREANVSDGAADSDTVGFVPDKFEVSEVKIEQPKEEEESARQEEPEIPEEYEAEFIAKSNDQLKEIAVGLGIVVRGNPSRQSLIHKLKQAGYEEVV